MKVIEINQPLSKEEKMDVLQELRGDIGESAFRRAIATVQSKHIVELMYYKGKKITRMGLCDKVNLTLRDFGCEPMSYSYFRDWL
ncbi:MULTISPECIES: hypothetical protein [unclassified Cytobacillus]|uniref:hypothetical protein n=1 Tax=unclassified Cytobacillus TaxID=2675268 RepID=UPI00203E5771|nr:hypothetical protein [Cytobacillus sp. AMY 15.2]MCM3093863.1 hypothetical protein [Cytobacillus sp. AMY 15.2]